MARWAKQYRKEPGEHGTFIVEETGLCTASEAASIEAGCTKRYRMVPIPQARGAYMKVLDGTAAAVVIVTPSTIPVGYNCVKIFSATQPFAPAQPAGDYAGQAILSYTIRYQQVGGVA